MIIIYFIVINVSSQYIVPSVRSGGQTMNYTREDMNTNFAMFHSVIILACTPGLESTDLDEYLL